MGSATRRSKASSQDSGGCKFTLAMTRGSSFLQEDAVSDSAAGKMLVFDQLGNRLPVGMSPNYPYRILE